MSTGVTILLIVVIFHFVVGFGYLLVKLSPKKQKKNNTKKASE